MKIDHIALISPNIDIMKDFYVHHFNACANDLYHNEKTGLKTYFLSFASGVRLEIMSRPDMQNIKSDGFNAGYAHIAFSVADDAAVDDVIARLALEGVEVIGKPRRTGDGYYESVILDPDGNHIEIVSEKH